MSATDADEQYRASVYHFFSKISIDFQVFILILCAIYKNSDENAQKLSNVTETQTENEQKKFFRA